MEHSQSWSSESASRPLSGAQKRWTDYLAPSLPDCLFAAIFIWLFATGEGGWNGLLADGDTGWHMRTGQWILEHGRVPVTDFFSFSKAGQPWFAWEWLSDVFYAWLHQAAGLKGILLYTAVVIGLFGVTLFRHMIWKGAAPAVVLPVSLLVIGASSFHYLARPHVITMLFLPAALWMLDRDSGHPTRAVWLLVPLTVVWVNLHGGFVALIACLGLMSVGTAAEMFLAAREAGTAIDWNPVRRYALLTVACAASSVVNPYGIELHRHVVAYLRSDWIRNNVEEFFSPRFRDESMVQFEILLFLGLMTAAWLVRQKRITPALWILFWGHSALGSVRHVPLYMIVAAPWVAWAGTELWNRLTERAPRKSLTAILADVSRDFRPACSRQSVWIPVIIAAFAVLNEPIIKWPRDFPSVKFPTAMIERYRTTLAAGRLLTGDEWADYLLYRYYPNQKVFVDGRSDFYGQEFGDDYVHMLNGQWKWESLFEKHRIDTVFAPRAWPIVSVLKLRSEWRLVAEEDNALLFVRNQPYRSTSAGPEETPGTADGSRKAALEPNENTRLGRR